MSNECTRPISLAGFLLFCCYFGRTSQRENKFQRSNVPLTQPQHHWVILLKLSKAFLPSVTQDWLSLSFPPNRRRPDVGQACRISSPVVLRQVSGGGLREGHHAHGGNPGLGVRRPLSEQTTPDSKLKCSQPKQGPVIRCLFQTLWLGSTCHVTWMQQRWPWLADNHILFQGKENLRMQARQFRIAYCSGGGVQNVVNRVWRCCAWAQRLGTFEKEKETVKLRHILASTTTLSDPLGWGNQPCFYKS